MTINNRSDYIKYRLLRADESFKDALILAECISFALETKFMDEFYDLELETGEVISPLIYSKSDWNNKYSITPFFENIKNEGIKLK